MYNLFKIFPLLVLLLPNFALAEDIKKTDKYDLNRFAVVDLKKIVDESTAAKSAQKEVEKLQKKYIKDAQKEERKLKKREEQLMKQKKALSQDAFIEKVKEFQERIQEGQKQVIKKRQILEASYMKSLEMIKEETYKVIAKIAKRKNLDLVFPSSQLLYTDKAIDISDEVLKNLNEQLSKVNINVEKSKK